jgi:cytochrome P450
LRTAHEAGKFAKGRIGLQYGTPKDKVGVVKFRKGRDQAAVAASARMRGGEADPFRRDPMTLAAALDPDKIVEIDLGGRAFKQNARAHLAEWARRPPFYVLGNGPPQVIVGRYADVHEIFSDPARFSSEVPRTGRGYEQFDKFMGVEIIAQMDGERHARIRRLLMPAFSSRSMARIQARITEIIDGMLDRIERRGNAFDGMADYGAQLVVGALLTAMVNLEERRKPVFLAFHEVLPLTTYTKPGENFPPECVRAYDDAAAMVDEIIAERRANPDPDVISALIQARDQDDKLSDKELFDQVFTLCGAALSATSRAAGGALLALYSHPDQLAELIRDPSLIPEAVEECLRIASNGYFTFPRLATRDTEVGGTRILTGMVVRPSPQAANYDPDVFPDPLTFDIHRHPKRILAFGAGPHHCIGNILGRTAITIAIRRLLERFPHARLADPGFTPVYGGAVGELRLQHLPMVIQ